MRITTLSVAMRLISLGWALLVAPLSLVLLVVAATWEGRGFATAALLAAFAPMFAVNAWEAGRRGRASIAAGMGLAWLILFSWLLWRAPTGTAGTSAKVQHLTAGKGGQFRRMALGNLLPEVDQLMLGFTLMPMIDPLLTTTQSSQLKKWTTQIYRELEKDIDFHALGSVMPLVYDELLGGGIKTGHAYIFVPPEIDRTKPAPVLVFFHGSGGNFKAYLWLLSRLADQLGIVVIAPSFGMGNWRPEETRACYEAAIAEASRIITIASDNIHVMGLSNGGMAVSQLAKATELQFRSLIFLSPVFYRDRFHSLFFKQECRGRSVLVITGKNDDRVPVDYVEKAANEMKSSGASVTFEAVDRADHFLLFSDQKLVFGRLAAWLKANGVVPAAH